MENLEIYKKNLLNRYITWEFNFLKNNKDIWLDEYLDAYEVIFENCLIKNISMISSNFKNCTFKNCIFEWWEIVWVMFINCNIENLTFRDIDVSFSFEDCNTKKLNFENWWKKL